MSQARRAVSFLTPVGGATPPTPETLRWFPLVGAGLGLALGVLWWATDSLWPPAVATALVLVADLGLTGMLHLDGLADTADALLPPIRGRQRRLWVMAAPDVGAFGLGTVVAVLILRWAALATLVPAPLLLAALWCLSRTTMVWVISRLRYARTDGGLATAFMGVRNGPAVAAGGLVLSLVLAALWDVGPGVAAVLSGAIGAGAVAGLASRRIGGFTGDVLGACGVIAETIGLAVAAAKW